MLPSEPTICVGQPTALDPSRAPDGQAVLWLQLPEAPRIIKGDAAGEIAAPADGRWTERSGKPMRIVSRRSWPAISTAFATASSPAAPIRRPTSKPSTCNLVGGDPYGGYCGVDQFFLWRPFKGTVNHRTPVPNLYHIGAATHPGPGLGGGSGYLLAQSLT